MKNVFKTILAVVLVGIAAAFVYAADPNYRGDFAAPADKTVSDSQWTASNWEIIDSLIFTVTDTGRVFITFEGVVELGPGDFLYFSSNDDSPANQSVPQRDTVILFSDKTARGASTQYFRYTVIDSVVSQTDLVDTIWFLGAVKSSGQSVAIRNVTIQARVADKDPS